MVESEIFAMLDQAFSTNSIKKYIWRRCISIKSIVWCSRLNSNTHGCTMSQNSTKGEQTGKA